MTKTPVDRALAQLVGTWSTSGVLVGEYGGTAKAWRGHDIYEFLPGGTHLAHRVDVVISGARRESLEILTPSTEAEALIHQTSYEQDGSIEHSIGSIDSEGRYRIDAGEARAILTFTSPTTMSARWDLRSADGSWREWMHVTFERVGDPHIEVRSRDAHTPRS